MISFSKRGPPSLEGLRPTATLTISRGRLSTMSSGHKAVVRFKIDSVVGSSGKGLLMRKAQKL